MIKKSKIMTVNGKMAVVIYETEGFETPCEVRQILDKNGTQIYLSIPDLIELESELEEMEA